jgi:hypothetical protein
MPAKPLELTGQRFGSLTAIRRDGKIGDHCAWICQCDCGSQSRVAAGNLRCGNIRSCGCQHSAKSHGLARQGQKAPEYSSWIAMKARCFRENHIAFRHYGGRGITVCDEWRNDFAAFLGHIGPKPSPAHSVDRIDNDGNYRPGNVRWATAAEQAANRRGKS